MADIIHLYSGNTDSFNRRQEYAPYRITQRMAKTPFKWFDNKYAFKFIFMLNIYIWFMHFKQFISTSQRNKKDKIILFRVELYYSSFIYRSFNFVAFWSTQYLP